MDEQEHRGLGFIPQIMIDRACNLGVPFLDYHTDMFSLDAYVASLNNPAASECYAKIRNYKNTSDRDLVKNEWKEFLSKDLGFDELSDLIGANKTIFPDHANVIFV
jgi:hypothetical protein